MMIRVPRRLAIAALIASATLLESCNDGLLHPPAPAAAVVNMTALLSRSSGGEQEAFDRADRVFVRFVAGDVVRMEQELPFAPSSAETIVRLEVPLRQLSEEMSAEIELRLGDRPLFRGASTTTLSAGTPIPLDFTLEPVVAAVTCGTGVVQLGSLGRTAQLAGAALFASGDTVRDIPVTWTMPANGPASVSDAGLVTALQDGDATATCSASGTSATRAVRVFAAVASAQVAPAAATIVAGTSLSVAATLFDTLGNVIPTSRPLTFTSSNPAVATVSASGLVSGVSAGSAQISATSGPVVASSALSVVVPSIALTIASSAVTGSSATLLGSVNPRGLGTQAWFEWGTNPALTTSTASPTQAVGSGSQDIRVLQPLTGLVPNTTYYFRTAASSSAGTVRGAILSFKTPQPPGAQTSTLDPTETQTYAIRGFVTGFGSATVAWFEYGTSPTLATSSKTTQLSVGSSSTALTVRQALANLQPSTTYYFRVVASNVGGTTSGAIASFRTGSAPSVAPASGYLSSCTPLTRTTFLCVAVMSGSANPNGALTDGWFEYGTSATLTSFSTTPRQRLNAGFVQVPFTTDVSAPSPIYFRAVAANASGIARSPIIQALSPVK